MKAKFGFALIAGSFVLLLCALAGAFQASLIPQSHLITVEDVAKILGSAHGQKPLIIQVGSRVLFQQAHIPGSEYIGPAASQAGVVQLQNRLKSVPKNRFIVLYCGCCPWNHCPNVKPAYDAVTNAGFTNVKVMFVPSNFGADWVDRGYPVAKGE